jgi:tRNA-dihydrouridine synthase
MRSAYTVDGIMIGRGSIGNPWIFRQIKHYFQTGNLLPPPTTQERIATCRKHLEESIAWKGEKTGILEMRRHYANYFKGYADIKTYRARLVEANELNAILETFEEIEEKYSSFAPILTLPTLQDNDHFCDA